MRPDRPLIGAVVTLAAGITTILVYCHGSTAFSAGYPFSGSQLHIDFTTNGPAVLGGVALIALGLLLMAWALLAAFVSQIVQLFGRDDTELHTFIARTRAPYVDAETRPAPVTMVEHKHES
jgi:hypothetical protein